MKRFNLVLGILLVVQIVFAVILLWPRASTSEETGPLLPSFDPENVVALTITDDQDKKIVINRQDDAWVMPEVDDFPVEGDKISPLLEKLADLTTNRLVTRTEGSHGRLQVAEDDFTRLLELEMADGTQSTVYIGSSGGSGATHVRTGDKPEVYLASAINPWDANTQVSSWIDTVYFTVPQTATVSLTLENPNGTFEFRREDVPSEPDEGQPESAEGDTEPAEATSWTMAGLAGDEIFNESAFNTMLNQATSLRMKAPLGKEEKPEYGLENPEATLSLTTGLEGETKTYTLLIGAKDEDNNYVIKSSESPYYVQVTEYTGDSFVQKTREDFIQPPPTAEPEPPVEVLPGVTPEPVLPFQSEPAPASVITATVQAPEEQQPEATTSPAAEPTIEPLLPLENEPEPNVPITEVLPLPELPEASATVTAPTTVITSTGTVTATETRQAASP